MSKTLFYKAGLIRNEKIFHRIPPSQISNFSTKKEVFGGGAYL